MMVPILMYHDIAARAAGGSRLCVPPAAFAAQLGYLAANGFSTVTARELAARASLPARTVVITFDDGFADFHSHALPLLRQDGFTATGFVNTGWVAHPGRQPARAPVGFHGGGLRSPGRARPRRPPLGRHPAGRDADLEPDRRGRA